jgi:hypothetical protein
MSFSGIFAVMKVNHNECQLPTIITEIKSENSISTLVDNNLPGIKVQNNPIGTPILDNREQMDNAKVPTITPKLKWNVPKNPSGNDLHFLIQLDDSPDFLSPVLERNSSSDIGFGGYPDNIPPYKQGNGSAWYLISTADSLTNGNTYWWRLRAFWSLDYSNWSGSRSFTVDTSVNMTSWHQTTGSQFNKNILNHTTPRNGTDNDVVLSSAKKSIGTGTGTRHSPFNIESCKFHCDGAMYTKDQIGTAGTITHVAWYRGSANADVINNITIYMKESTDSNLSGSAYDTSAKLQSGTLIWSGNLSLDATTTGWYPTITLITPFQYSGTKNLIVSVRHQDGSYELTGSFFRFTNTGNTDKYREGESNSQNPPSINAASSSKPNIQFEIISSSIGTIISNVIDFDDNPNSSNSWGMVEWHETSGGGTSDITVNVQYWTGSAWNDTPGKSSSNSPINISSLNTTTYNQLRLVASFEIGNGFTPELEDWSATWILRPYVPDTILPSISNQHPVGTIADNKPEIGVDYTDESGIDTSSIVITLDTVDVTTQAIVTGANVSYTPATALTEGLHNVSLEVKDNSPNKNKNTTSWSFTIKLISDSTPPSISNVHPMGIISNNKPEIGVDYTDASSIDTLSIKLTVDTVDVTSLATVTAANVKYTPATALTEGLHNISLEVWDNSSNKNKNTTSWTFTVQTVSDMDPPLISNIHPISITANTKPEIGADYTDASSIDTSCVKLTVDTTDVTSLATVTAANVKYTPATALTEGLHNVSLEVKDDSPNKNKNTTSWSFTIQLVPTYLTHVNITPPSSVIFVGKTFDFTAQGYDQNWNELGGLSYDWSVSPPSLGSLKDKHIKTVKFTAGSTPNNGKLSVNVTKGNITIGTNAAIKITSQIPVLDSIAVVPSSWNFTDILQHKQFTVHGYNDTYELNLDDIKWSLAPSYMGILSTNKTQAIDLTATSEGGGRLYVNGTCNKTTMQAYAEIQVKGVTGAITGKVTEFLTGKAIINANVSLVEGDSTQTDTTGYYFFHDLKEGKYVIKVNATGYYSVNRTVNIVIGDTITADFELYPIGHKGTGAIVGTVENINGELVKDATITLLDYNEKQVTSVITDKYGKFAFTNLTPGIYHVEAVKNGYEDNKKIVLVTENCAISVELVLNKKSESQFDLIMCMGIPLIALIIILILIVVLVRRRKLHHKKSERKCSICGLIIPEGVKDCPKCVEEVISRRPMVIDEVFLMTIDGRLIRHETRRLKPEVDKDILAGMLVAVQSFIKDSFRGEPGALDEMKFGELNLQVGRGKYLILAVLISGQDIEGIRRQIVKMVRDIESNHESILKDWDGNLEKVEPIKKYLDDFLSGKYRE